MNPTREIVYHLAVRYLTARRALKGFDVQRYQHPHMRYALNMQCNEARNCYSVAKMVLVASFKQF